MNPGVLLILWHFNDWGGVAYTPSLKFNDARNSQYFVMGWP